MQIQQVVDQIALTYVTFFLSDTSIDGDGTKYRSSLLYLYFTGPQLRSAFYTGYAGSLLYHTFVKKHNTGIYKLISSSPVILWSSVSFLLFASYLNFWNRQFGSNKRGIPLEERSNWYAMASDSLGVFGSFWIGAGDGNWFGFIGHNGPDEKTILPAHILEQMTVHRDGYQPEVREFEEVNEDSE